MQTPKCFLLDIKYNPWRTSVVQQRFKDAELEVERFEGVHGQTIGIMPCRTVWDAERENPFRNNPGKTSITINKLMLFQHILDKGYEEAIIFENDVTLVDNFKEEFAKSYAALPSDWEAVHIGSCCLEGKPRVILNDRVQTVKYPLCCHALMFKRSALEVAIEQLKTSCWGTNSDIILAKKVYPKLKHYCFIPMLANPDNTDSEAAKTEVWTDAQGWFDWEQIYDEQLTGFGNNKAVMVEVGTWKGRSAIYLASEIKRRLKDVQFFCVDHWRGNADEPNMAEMIKAANGDIYPEFIRNINRCGVADYLTPLRMSSVEGATQFKDRSVNFCLLDAGHSFEDVSADLEAWYPKMVAGSSMAGHDVHADGVRDALKAFCKKIGKEYRVWEQCWILDGCNA